MKKRRHYVLIIDDSETDYMLLNHALKKSGYEPVDANLLWRIPEGTAAIICDWRMTPEMEEHRDSMLDAAGVIGLPRCVFTGNPIEDVAAEVANGVEVIQKGESFRELTNWLEGVAPLAKESTAAR